MRTRKRYLKEKGELFINENIWRGIKWGCLGHVRLRLLQKARLFGLRAKGEAYGNEMRID